MTVYVVNQELAQLKRALDLENESLVSELAHLRTRFPERQDDVEELDISTSTYTDEPFAIQIPAVKSSETDTAIDMGDVWAQSRLRKRKMTGKRRTIQDLNEVSRRGGDSPNEMRIDPVLTSDGLVNGTCSCSHDSVTFVTVLQ